MSLGDSGGVGSASSRRFDWSGRRARPIWQTAVVVALMAAGVLCTIDAWADIVNVAQNDDEASHVFLVPAVAAWLLWVRRERLRGYVPSAMWVGPAIVAVGWIVNRLGDAYLLQSAWHFGALLVVVGAFLSVFGGGLLVRFLPVFVALCFLVPVPGKIRQQIAIPLQTVTAEITRIALETFGVGAERMGNMLRINNHDVMIVEACNGLRMVFALVMVSYAFAYGVPLRNGIRVAVVLLSPLTAIVFNVIRLVPIVWAYGNITPEVAETLHDLSGWLMLPAAFLALLGLMRLLRWAQIPITPYVLAHGA